MQGRPIFRGKFAKITHKSLDWALYASAVTPIVFSLTQRVYSDTNMSMSGLLVSFSTNFSGFHTGRLWKRATVAWGGRKYFLPWLDELLFRFRLCFCAIFQAKTCTFVQVPLLLFVGGRTGKSCKRQERGVLICCLLSWKYTIYDRMRWT